MATKEIKRLYTTGRDVETAEGDIISMADVTPDMEYVYPVHPGDMLSTLDAAGAAATRGVARRRPKANRRGGRSYPELSGRDVGRYIDEHLIACEQALGRPLTEDEVLKESLYAERMARGLPD